MIKSTLSRIQRILWNITEDIRTKIDPDKWLITAPRYTSDSLKDNVTFFDAREPREYDVSHIENALLVGYNHFDINTVKNIPKDKKIIVYCSMGYRSEKITKD